MVTMACDWRLMVGDDGDDSTPRSSNGRRSTPRFPPGECSRDALAGSSGRRTAGAARTSEFGLYNETHRGSGTRTSPLYSPAGSSCENVASSSGPDATRTGNEDGKKHSEKDDETYEEVKGDDLGMRLKAVQALSREVNPRFLKDSLPEALSMIERQRNFMRDLADKNKELCRHAQTASYENDLLRRQRNESNTENDLLRRKLSDMTHQYELLASMLEHRVAGSASVTAQAEEAPTFDAVQAKLHASIFRAREVVEQVHRHRVEEGALRSREHGASVSSQIITGEASAVPSVLASSVVLQDGDSPAARASALLAREGTAATTSMTPPVSTLAALEVSAPTETRGVVGTTNRSGGPGSSNVREPVVPSGRGVGSSTHSSRQPTGRTHGTVASSRSVRPSTNPANQAPVRRQGMVSSSGGRGPSARPASRPPAGRRGMTAASGGGRPPPGPVNRATTRTTGIVASSGGAGPSAGPANRLSSRRQGITAPSGGIGQRTCPTDQPPARQSKVTKKTTTRSQPLDCTRGTITSRSRLRTAIRTTAPRGMVF